MGKKLNLKGRKFGRLFVTHETDKRDGGGGIIWLCLCSCGKVTHVYSQHLRRGNTKSCGCLHKDMAARQGKKNCKHGDTHKARLYNIWAGMKARCYNSKDLNYKYYGARGIEVCREWKDDYLTFKFWAILSGYADNLTIDRKNHKGNYEPSNCQWLTNSENVKKQWADRRQLSTS